MKTEGIKKITILFVIVVVIHLLFGVVLVTRE